MDEVLLTFDIPLNCTIEKQESVLLPFEPQDTKSQPLL